MGIFEILATIVYSYFINHYTKTTSWEDPRVRYQQIGKPTSNPPPPPSTATVTAPVPSAVASGSTAPARPAAATATSHPYRTVTSSAGARKNSAESASNLLSEAKSESAQLQVFMGNEVVDYLRV